MNDIANHLKISKKTLYQYFANKDDVVEQVMLHRREKRQELSNLKEVVNLNSIETILLIKNHIINDLQSRLPANYFDMKKYHPTVHQRIAEIDSDFTKNFFTALLTNGMKGGYIREGIDIELQIYLLGKQLEFLREPEVISNMTYPIERVISTILDNFLLSIASEKGRKEIERLHEEYNDSQKEQTNV